MRLCLSRDGFVKLGVLVCTIETYNVVRLESRRMATNCIVALDSHLQKYSVIKLNSLLRGAEELFPCIELQF